jgi:signal transduction histidine kinase
LLGARRLHDRAGLTWLELATCLAEIGETRAATRHLKQGLHRVDTAGNAEARMNARKVAAAVYALLGDPEAKLEQLEALCGLQEAWIRENKARPVHAQAVGPSLQHPEMASLTEDAAYLEAIQTFTGKAAHDMKEPLRMIGSFSALLRRQYGALLDAEGNEFLDIVQDAGERMNELLAKLLDYTRLGTSGKAVQALDLTDTVTLAAHRLRSQLEQREALLETLALPGATGLRDELELMMVQLLDNALKFNRSSRPHIVISAVEESDAVTIKVQDNGIGIPVANRNEVFDLFRRLHPRTEFRGSGIGLTMVARIAALHGGNCWVENSRLGGCCICVRLPK